MVLNEPRYAGIHAIMYTRKTHGRMMHLDYRGALCIHNNLIIIIYVTLLIMPNKL